MSDITYNRHAQRTYSGILPALWDKVERTVTSPTVDTYTYSMLNTDTGNQIVTAIIVVTYTDNSKECVSTVEKTYSAEEY